MTHRNSWFSCYTSSDFPWFLVCLPESICCMDPQPLGKPPWNSSRSWRWISTHVAQCLPLPATTTAWGSGTCARGGGAVAEQSSLNGIWYCGYNGNAIWLYHGNTIWEWELGYNMGISWEYHVGITWCDIVIMGIQLEYNGNNNHHWYNRGI